MGIKSEACADIDPVILRSFVSETKLVLGELGRAAENLERVAAGAAFPEHEITHFWKTIDRIRGGAKILTIQAPGNPLLEAIAGLTDLCRVLGEKTIAEKAARVVPVLAGFWADTVEALEELVMALEGGIASPEVIRRFPAVVGERLAWLFAHVAPEEKLKSDHEKIRDIRDLLTRFERG